MADLLGEVDVNIPSRAPMRTLKTAARRKTRVLSPPISQEKRMSMPKRADAARPTGLPDTPPMETDYNDDSLMGSMDDDAFPPSDPIPSSPAANAADRKVNSVIKVEDEDEDMMEVAQTIGDHQIKSASINISGSRPPKMVKKEKAYPSPASSSPTRPPVADVDPSLWNEVNSKLNVLSSQEQTASFGKLKIEDGIEADGSLRMFWTDYTEVNGSLCLFGKVKDQRSGAYVSAFVKMDNILRKLYFLPRTYRQNHGRDTSTEVQMGDVYQEVDEVMSKLKVGMHKIKPCERNYAFELADIPKKADYLKLMYPYHKPALSMEMKGDTFSHVFGTNTALFEQFVLWKEIMGPCWLKIEASEFVPLNNASWCKCEVQVASPKAVTVLRESDNMDAPRFTFMSIALRTTLNVRENKQEILVVSARVYEDISLTDKTKTEDLPCKTYTIMRPTDGSFPVGFEALSKKQRGTIMLEKTEGMVLAKFLALIERADPDVFMGHQLQDVDYPILLSRFREIKTPGWHRIGRLRRGEWPKNMGKGGGSFFTERSLVSGRLLCDVANDQGKVCVKFIAFRCFADPVAVFNDQVSIMEPY